MTHEEIDKLEAGREMDALIAHHVMGLRVIEIDVPEFGKPTKVLDMGGGNWLAIEWYSEKINKAWLVVEKMTAKDGNRFTIQFREGLWNVGWMQVDYDQGLEWCDYCTQSPEAPLSICRAALKTVFI